MDIPGPGQRFRDPGQDPRLLTRVGDRAGDLLGGSLVLPRLRQRLRDPAQGLLLLVRDGDGGGEGLGAGDLAEGSPDGGQPDRDFGVAVDGQVAVASQA